MKTYISRIILYVHDIAKVAAFYQKHFDFVPVGTEKGWLELSSQDGGCNIALHQASMPSRERGRSPAKIVFGVVDVHTAKKQFAARGLKFGKVYDLDGFAFTNASDPEGNPIQISSRGMT
jgi:predicted enzyme related to lactoylglutathione lyase